MLVALAEAQDRDQIVETACVCGVEVDVDAELSRPCARLWVARLQHFERPIAGFLLAWAVADELHVIDLAARPDCRRRGVARALLDALLAHARAEPFRIVLLEVRRNNHAALRLYQGAGFDPVGLRPGYYANPPDDAILMQLTP
jgi:ribosomal-protein-alanine N-acetyltransferase